MVGTRGEGVGGRTERVEGVKCKVMEGEQTLGVEDIIEYTAVPLESCTPEIYATK